MKLSENLIKEFAKITKDDTPKARENYMYGTVHVYGNYMDVLFDGASDSTPCTTTVTVEDGDRVLVLVKERQAVIMSNITKPTINTDYLEAGEARISGTIHAATYEDSTGNFTMDIGSETPTDDAGNPIVDYSAPAFKIAGYIGEEPNQKYLEIEITTYKLDIADLPQLNISASFKSGPDDPNAHVVGVGIGESGIQFFGEWPPGGSSNRVSTAFPWGYNPG